MKTAKDSTAAPDDFVRKLGLPVFAHLLRRLSDQFVAAAVEWSPEVGATAPPRTASTLLLLDGDGPLSVTTIATRLRQSHPLVIHRVEQLRALGLVELSGDSTDGRRTVVSLTRTGSSQASAMRVALRVFGAAYHRLFKEVEAEVFDALWRIHDACQDRPFVDRLRDEAARRSGRSRPRRGSSERG